MLPLPSIAKQIGNKRKTLGLSQTALAKKARISRATLDAAVARYSKAGTLAPAGGPA